MYSRCLISCVPCVNSPPYGDRENCYGTAKSAIVVYVITGNIRKQNCQTFNLQ